MSKLILLLLALSILSQTNLHSQYYDYNDFDELSVGMQPVYSFHWGTNTNVFCAGYDANNDGIYQSQQGDSYPTWWTIGRSGGRFISNNMKQFEFSSINQDFKPAIDFQNRIIYIPFKNKISSYDLQTTNLIEDAIYEGNIEAVRSAGPHLLIIDKGEMNDDTGDYENCKLVVFDINMSMILQEIPLLPNAIDVIYYQTEDGELAVGFLSEPSFMVPNYQIQYGILPHQQMPELETLTLEEEVSSFIQFNNAIYVSYFGSSEITKISPDGSILELSNGLAYNEEWDFYGTQSMVTKGENLFILTKYDDIRTLDKNDAIDFISDLYSEYFSNKFSFWNNQDYVILFDTEELENDKVYVGRGKVDDDYTFKYANVGSQPSKIVYSEENDTYNVFCLGVDANFNGEFDDGDELPSWWIVKGAGSIALTEKVLEFGMGDIKFPTRLAYDKEIGVLYIPHKDRIASYDIYEHSVIEETVAEVNAISIDLAGPHLLFSVRNSDQADQVQVFDRDNSSILQNIPAGDNLLQTLYFTHTGGLGVAMLNEGFFGQGNSTIMYGNLPHQQMPELKELNIGDGGNDMIYSDEVLYTVSNGSHELNVIDFNTDEVLTFWTGTNGWNGPRNLYFGDAEVLTTTYQGDIRIIDNYGLLEIIKVKGKLEDMFIDMEEEFLMTCVINNDDYSPSKEVAYLGQLMKSVENNSKEEIQLQVYPNPTTEFVYIRQNEPAQTNIEVYDITGKKVYYSDFYGAITKVDVVGLNLGNGTYIVKLTTDKEIKTAKFNVIK